MSKVKAPHHTDPVLRAEIGRRIRQARLRLGIPQHELGRRMGTGQGSITAWERGCQAPIAGILVRLCRVLGVSADWLLGLSDPSEAA